MTTPAPEERAGEAFTESAAEAVQTAVMAYRLVMAIADAARRHQQRRQRDKEDDLPTAEEAVNEISADVERLLPSDICGALMGEADWPQLAQQLLALRTAGVDLDQVLPRVGEIVANVRDQVAAKAKEESADQWVRVVRETLPAGPVREAILTSPAWPEMAATMTRLEERGVNVREVLAAAHNEVLSVDQTVAKGLGAAAEPGMSRDAQLSYGPLTTGLDLPRDLDLSDRERALTQLAISPQENQRYTRWVREAMPGFEREADLLVASRQWPLLACRMAQMEADGEPVREHLTRLAKDTSWQAGPDAQLGMRLVQAASDALRRPVGEAPGESRVTVNTAAARATSPSVGPPKAAKAAASAEAGTAPHRQAAPVPKSGRTR
ncbi:hypothetical protein ROS62_29485 [Streptomyces sp. DSM 41972]|uniref:DUF222 domain-containing protein n=1 Tax=Streptomyces althioticus subsp. attaecolombicae TaxID=3075534 RepID=A0ABU3I7S1_9ACTN|nr:hypothetical protein [Streptomyces sp. DSM 41972]SCD37110.1 hypothetical protein GA0115238_105818 [Streptomyces sp. di50b]SCE52962.1 hypothetical protein GA0115245_145818 [Streptomyces sp. di188]